MTVGSEFHVLIVETPSLGDRCYVVHDGSVGVVIDPQRDIDRVLAELDAASVRLTHVLETHVHNDYVTGGLALARLTGAEYVLCAASGYRASIAASLLARARFPVVLVDDEFDRAEAAGLTIVTSS